MIFKRDKISASAAKKAVYYYDTERRRKAFLKRLLVAALLASVCITTFNFAIDRDPPAIIPQNFSRAIGSNLQTFNFKLEDEMSAVESATVDVIHAGTRKRLFQGSFPSSSRQQTLQFMISAEQIGLIDSTAVLEIKAVDNSIFANENSYNETLQADYKAPQIRILRRSGNLKYGDFGWIIFKATDPFLSEVGVKIGDNIFRAYPLYLFDAKATAKPDHYFAFFTFVEGDPESKATVYANDSAANNASAILPLRALSLGSNHLRVDYELSEIKDLIDPLVEQYFQTGQSHSSLERLRHLSAAEQTKIKFELVGRQYVDWVETKIKKLLPESKSEPLWRERGFGLIGGTHLQNRFGSEERVFVAGVEMFQRKLNSDKLTSSSNSVVAIGDGVVVEAGSFGPYGKAVIVDHGFGISSVYFNLAQVGVERGMLVKKGSEIGKLGQTVFVKDNNAQLQIRLAGVAINPTTFLAGSGGISDFTAQVRAVVAR